MTLADVYRAQLSRVRDASSERTLPVGWLLSSGVAELVEPFLDYLPRDDDDLAHFSGLSGSAAAALLDRLPESELADKQNLAPTLGTILRSAVAHPGVVEVHGYLVGPRRADERLTAEGVIVRAWPELDVTMKHEPQCDCGELMARVRDVLTIDDFDAPPDEMQRLIEPTTGEWAGWRLWWD